MSDARENIVPVTRGSFLAGQFRIEHFISVGTRVAVCLCADLERNGQPVAVKMLQPQLAFDGQAVQGLVNEIVASHAVDHPNVIKAFDYFHHGTMMGYSMEYVGSGDLADRLGPDVKLASFRVLRLLTEIGFGLEAIHSAGIVHRDLKPENILLTASDSVKVGDFGAALTPGLEPIETGVVGTVGYISPEYLEHGQIDQRSDLYALGVMGYEMLAGRLPYTGTGSMETIIKQIKFDPDPLSELVPNCPVALEAIVFKLLERDPDRRYQTARDLIDDLEKVRLTLPWTEEEESW